MSYTLIERREITEAASSTSFENIPQIYTDLVLSISLRSTGTDSDGIFLRFNASTSGYSTRTFYGNGTSALPSINPYGVTSALFLATAPGASWTANSFNNGRLQIPNYRSSTAKSTSLDGVGANNATVNFLDLGSGVWTGTDPITSMLIYSNTNTNLAIGSSISLYGINRQQAIGAPKAVGGTITFANGYWYHAFTGSSSFEAQQTLEADYIVVAGGGSGGSTEGGGGGAGGVLAEARTIPVGSYPILVGAGAASNASGANSTFFGRTAIGGGRGGNSSGTSTNGGLTGGSGGGAGADWNSPGSNGSGTTGQGFAGGTSARRLSGGSGGGYGGGGGGASAVGGNGVVAVGGVGGAGMPWGGSYYGGGGGGGVSQSAGFGAINAAEGGIGGGGKGSGSLGNGSPATATTGTAGTANTGGGGGGGGGDGVGGGNGYAGGSGIVIVRYKA